MEKEYRLTVTFNCKINDEAGGIGDIDTMANTHLFLEALSGDDDVLLEMYKLKLFNTYLLYFGNSDVFASLLNVRETTEILLPFAAKLPAEVAGYIKGLYDVEEPRDKETFAEWDRKKALLEEQLGPLEVSAVTFAEIKD